MNISQMAVSGLVGQNVDSGMSVANKDVMPVYRGSGPGSGQNTSVDTQPSTQDIQRSLQQVNKALKEIHSEMRLDWNQKLHRVILKVTNVDTGEIIQQIPPQHFVDWAEEFTRLVGMLFDKKA